MNMFSQRDAAYAKTKKFEHTLDKAQYKWINTYIQTVSKGGFFQIEIFDLRENTVKMLEQDNFLVELIERGDVVSNMTNTTGYELWQISWDESRDVLE